MLEAFRELGYEVLDISGYAEERAHKFKALRQRIKAGAPIDFCYSENATIPPMITEKKHLPPHPFLDFSIFAYLKRHGIPTGVFYRDIYWRDREYPDRVGRPLALAMTALYRYELAGYDRLCSTVFLPSEQMAAYVPPLKHAEAVALPPGGDIVDEPEAAASPLSLFYIGGLGNKNYQLHKLFEAVKAIPDISFTLCTTAERWEAVAHEYPRAENIRVVHATGEEREQLFARANLCYVSVDPEFYGKFAVPVKLYEYLGRGKAMLAQADTLAGDIITGLGVGFAATYTAEDMERMLRDLAHHPEKLQDAAECARQVRHKHTWRARAATVVEALHAR
ncbi:MAG: glycosyltransferase [Flaviflexus sp.]|nr:glycosyltransferase [Flaviflexus sp.]